MVQNYTVRVEGKGEPILFVPGVDQEAFRTSEFPRYIQRKFRDVEREVVFAPRPYELDRGTTTGDMADMYVEMMEEEGIDDLAGVSLGGMIAQEIADRKDIEKLLAGFTGLKMSGEGRKKVEKWEELLEKGKIGKFYMKALEDVQTSGRHVLPLLSRFTHPLMPSSPIETIRISVKAALKHDASERGLDVGEALVVGAENDRLFSPEDIRELADELGADKKMLEGGHASFGRKRGLHAIMNDFFS